MLQGEDGLCQQLVEAHFIVDTNIDSLCDKMIAEIEEKRKALGI